MSRKPGFKHSKATKIKMSESSMGKLGTNKGRKFSTTWRKKISKSLKGHPGLDFEKNPNWTGGRHQDSYGYVMLCIGKNKRRREHIVIMEQHLKRSLAKEERVHHKNGVRNDNRQENLQLFESNSAHIKYEQKMNTFIKQLMYGNIHPKLGEKVRNLFEDLD